MKQTKYDVFISYSRKDYIKDDVVIPGNPITAIIKMFDEKGISYWLDKEGIYSGQEFVEMISTAIANSKMLVFVSSKHSNASIWTVGEIFEALDGDKLIIPVRIDDSPYNKKFKLLIRPLDYVDYYVQHNTALPQLLRAVKNEKERLAGIEEKKRKQEFERQKELQKEEIKKQIKEKAKEFLALAGQQDYILKDLYSKNKLIDNTTKCCPVCRKEAPIQSSFCTQCGWQYSKLYCIDGNDLPIHDEPLLELARKNWKSLSNAIVLQKENESLTCEKGKKAIECNGLKTSLFEVQKEREMILERIAYLEERNKSLERKLKEAETTQREECKLKMERKGLEFTSNKQVKELKHEWEFAEILVKSKKVSFVFERDSIEESIDIFKFQEILFCEYGILLDFEEIKSFKTIGKLKEYILKRVK